ncbi:MAG: tetratricopeptide repeat-containing sensor histidine kinase [Bacteroidia bacterium]|nr:tetratricopeptide repeat-containing sensor histidine kinase [Bacteroidia bacterium]
MHIRRALGFFIIFILYSGNFLFAQEAAESAYTDLRRELQFAENDSAKIHILSELCAKLGGSRPDSGIYYCQLAESIAAKASRKADLAEAFWKEGTIHSTMGNYPRELELNLNGLRLVESLKDTALIARGLMQIGNTYFRLEENEAARDYYLKSLRFSLIAGDERRSAGTFNNLGNVLLSQNKLDSALIYFEKALEINQRTRNKNWEAINHFNIGKIRLKEKNFDEALENFRKSEDLNREINSRKGEASCYRLMGQTYLAWCKYDQAELALRKSLALYESIQARPGISETYEQLSHLYEATGNMGEALKYFKLYHALDDSVKNEGVRTQIAHSQQVYDLEKQKKQDELRNKENELERQKQLNRRTQLMYFFVFGFIVLLLGGFVAIKRARDQKRINSNLEKVVVQRTEALQTANEELNLFIYKSSHDLKGPLASVQGLVMVAEMEQSEEGVRKYLSLINQKVGQLDTILQRLIDTINIGEGKIEITTVSLMEALAEVKTELGQELQTSQLQIRAEWKGGDSLQTSRELLKAILFNLVQNSLRFADAAKKERWCVIKTQPAPNGCYLEVSDNGQGIPAELQKKVWNMFWRGHRDARGSGLGLYIVKNATQKLGGTFTLTSREKEGTTVKIFLPNSNPAT